MTGSALVQPLTPAECAVALDPVNCCEYAADEATRVDTARMILKVHARTVGDPPVPEDESHYYNAINGWAVNGSGQDGIGEDGAVYKESILSNFGRWEMWLYLEKIFNWSSDMELVIYDEIWETHADDSMTYMLVNKWFGSTAGGYYEQPGISIVKFRPGEGCAAYQRDYFSEGDTWWGMDFAQAEVRQSRDASITELHLTGRCVDDDKDGYTKYEAATGCPQGASLDCDDYNDTVNPGVDEITPEPTDPICNDGIDNNCNGRVDECGSPCATLPATPEGPMDLLPFFALFLVPAIYGYVLKRRLARNRIK